MDIISWLSTNHDCVDPINRAALNEIERAQFLLCLDPFYPEIDPKAPVTATHLEFMSNWALHGKGSTDCSCNRWFDHSVQVIYCQ